MLSMDENMKLEGECYLKTKSEKLKLFRVVLDSQDIFFYRIRSKGNEDPVMEDKY